MTEEITVAVCDDEEAVYFLVKELLQAYSDANQVVFRTEYYADASLLLNNIERYELILLDIEMPEMDGIEFGRALLKKCFDGKIIMLSGRSERFKEVFEIGAFRFVTKPVDDEEFFLAITDFLKTRVGRNRIILHQGQMEIPLQEKDIYCIFSKESITVIFTELHSFRSEASLGEWEERLDSRMFFRCHRQAVVNLSYIEKIEEDTILLKNKDKVPLSRRKRMQLKEKYLEYDIKYR